MWGAGLLIAVVLAAAFGPQAHAQAAGYGGTRIFAVDGFAAHNLTLSQGGTYFLGVGTNDTSSAVQTSLYYNGSLLGQENGSVSSFHIVSLPAGNYSLHVNGSGRAALAWDFTNGSRQTFPDNESLVALLIPQNARVDVTVAMGDAQRISLSVYDASLLLAANFTFTADGTQTVELPSNRASVAYLAATVEQGNPGGLFGLSWTSEPVTAAPLNFFAWPLFLLWILVPVAIAAVVIGIRRRRQRRERLRG